MALDDGAPDGNDMRFDVAFAQNRKRNAGIGFAAHPLDRLIERQSLDADFIEPGDEVARPQSGRKRRRVFESGNDPNRASLHTHFHAESAIFAAVVLFQFAIVFRLQIIRKGIQSLNYSADCVANEFSLIDRSDVLGFDLFDCFSERAHRSILQRAIGGGQVYRHNSN